MKKCPFCAEEIQDEAVVCRHCGRDLVPMPPQPSMPVSAAQVPPPGYPTPARTNGLAIAAMVLGIVWIYGIGSVLALAFGYTAKNQIDRSGGVEQGRGMAVAGIVLGWIGVAGIVLLIIGLIAAEGSGSYGY